MPRPLLSEALRGEGAVLRDEHGVAFMAERAPARRPRAPRRRRRRDRPPPRRPAALDHLWLDATAIADFAERFPTIWRSCQAVGLDPRARLAAGRARRALPLRRRVHRPRRRHRRSRASGPAARRRAPACTAPTGSRRTRCSTAWCSAARGRRDRRRARTRPSRTGVLARRRAIAGRRPGRQHRQPSTARHERPRAELQRVMTSDAGVLRDGVRPRAGGSSELAGRCSRDDPADELRNLARPSAGRSSTAAPGARGVAGHAHAPRLSRSRRRAFARPVSSQRGPRRRVRTALPPTSGEPSA